MKEGKPPKRFAKEELIAAKQRLDVSPDLGSDEEYFAAFRDTYRESEDVRPMATRHPLKEWFRIGSESAFILTDKDELRDVFRCGNRYAGILWASLPMVMVRKTGSH